MGCGDLRDGGGFAGWRREPPLKTLVDEPGVALVGKQVYLAGGIAESKGRTVESSSRFETYELGTGRIQRLPDMPQRLNHIGLAHHDGSIYVFGGFKDRLLPVETTNEAWRYRIAERRWEKLAPMPTTRGAMGVAVVGDRIYVVGGLNSSGPRSEVEVYDTRSGEWSSASRMPTPREHLAVTAARGQVYAIAGRRPGGIVYGAFERYDPKADRWTQLVDYPNPFSGLRAVAAGGKLVVSGGEHPGQIAVRGQVWSWDLAGEEWRQERSLPVPKHGHGVVAANGRMYVLGGSTCVGFKPQRTVESTSLDSSS